MGAKAMVPLGVPAVGGLSTPDPERACYPGQQGALPSAGGWQGQGQPADPRPPHRCRSPLGTCTSQQEMPPAEAAGTGHRAWGQGPGRS